MIKHREIVLAGFAGVIVVLCPGVATAQENCVATGDVDCSGGPPNVDDASRLDEFFSISGTIPPCPYQMDINGDCIVDRTDYGLLLDCILDPDGPQCPQVPTCCDPVPDRLCCIDGVGDPNGGGDEPSIGDVSVIIDAKFITGNCHNICISAADINRSGGSNPTCDDITIGDISMLIDCLFISGDVMPCYQPCL